MTASLDTGATFSKGDVKTAIKETSNTAEGKAILEAKSSLWELYQACMEKSRVLTLLQRKGMKNKGNDLRLPPPLLPLGGATDAPDVEGPGPGPSTAVRPSRNRADEEGGAGEVPSRLEG